MRPATAQPKCPAIHLERHTVVRGPIEARHSRQFLNKRYVSAAASRELIQKLLDGARWF